MITPLGWLERVPTYKEQKENLKEKDLNTYGFLGYPVCNRRIFCSTRRTSFRWAKIRWAHVELTREIARRSMRSTRTRTRW